MDRLVRLVHCAYTDASNMGRNMNVTLCDTILQSGTIRVARMRGALTRGTMTSVVPDVKSRCRTGKGDGTSITLPSALRTD